MLCQKRLGNFRSEIAKIYAKRVTAGFFHIFKRLHHMDLTLNDANRTLINILFAVFLFIRGYERLPSVHR